MDKERVVLCAANAYTKKYYLNDGFSLLPQRVQDELQIMCVLHTEEIGGVLSLYFDEEGNLNFETSKKDDDFFFDEIGSGLKIRQMQREKEELLESLELFYKTFFMEGAED